MHKGSLNIDFKRFALRNESGWMKVRGHIGERIEWAEYLRIAGKPPPSDETLRSIAAARAAAAGLTSVGLANVSRIQPEIGGLQRMRRYDFQSFSAAADSTARAPTVPIQDAVWSLDLDARAGSSRTRT
jgi:hypothetical protein